VELVGKLNRIQNILLSLLFVTSSILAFRFVGNIRLLSSISVDEAWVGSQGLSTLAIWPSLNSPQNELAYGDFPSWILLTLVKCLNFLGVDQGLYSVYILMYRFLSVLALFGIYFLLLKYPNDFRPEVWKIASTIVFVILFLYVSEINALAKPDALSLFFLLLFVYAVNPKSGLSRVGNTRYVIALGLIIGLLISTKFFGLVLMPSILAVIILIPKKFTNTRTKLSYSEKRSLRLLILFYPIAALLLFIFNLLSQGKEATNQLLTIKWSTVSFGSQQAYSFEVLLIITTSAIAVTGMLSTYLLRRTESFGVRERILSGLIFSIPVTGLINLDGFASFRFFKSLYFFQLKTNNGHFVREKSSLGLTIQDWNIVFLILVFVAVLGLYLGGRSSENPYYFEISLFLILICFFSTRTVSKTYLFPLLMFVAIGLATFISWSVSNIKFKLNWLPMLAVISITILVANFGIQFRSLKPENLYPRVAIGSYLEKIGSKNSKIYADAEMYVPTKFTKVTTSWAGTWTEASNADFLLLSGILIDVYGVERDVSDVVNTKYAESYEFYSKAIEGTAGYCKVRTWRSNSTYTVLLSKDEVFCKNLEIHLK
jgi:hypothetical protein